MHWPPTPDWAHGTPARTGCCSTPPESPARRPIAKSLPSSNSAAWRCSTASPACWSPPVPQLPGLGELLREAVRAAERPESAPGPAGPQPELFEREGRWGFRLAGQVVIPPLYDNGFDFTEGLAAVRLGQTWHYIDPAGRTRLSCPGCQAVKPFRNGRAQIVRNGRRAAIDPSGRILEN